ncbi:MAG: TRASH domain-containing protein [Caldicoprobacterales bacterium]|jgi:YHS domain-containing protein|nr:TRASH domain-containing protein [Clostridiales bacterium]
MEMLNSILRITMIVLLFRAIFTIATSFALSKKMKQAQQNTTAVNQQLMELQKKQQAELLARLVHDDYCGKTIEKDKAYIIRSDNHLHYFCSWECRQNFIQEAG